MIEQGFLSEGFDVDPDAITPEMRRRMQILACEFAGRQDDPQAVAGELLDMLGLRGDRNA